jgi:hypothetical protein
MADKLTPQQYTAIRSNPQLSTQLDHVLNAMIAKYRWVMEHGTNSEQIQLMRTALPDLMRSRRAEEEGARDKLQREAFMRMRDGFAEHIKVNVPEWPAAGQEAS